MRQERRKRTRVPIQFEITVSVGRKKITAKTLNVSLTGILCASDPVFTKDKKCKIEIDLGASRKIKLNGTIIRTDDNETAISYLPMTEENFLHLKRLIQYNYGDADAIDAELKLPAFDNK